MNIDIQPNGLFSLTTYDGATFIDLTYEQAVNFADELEYRAARSCTDPRLPASLLAVR